MIVFKTMVMLNNISWGSSGALGGNWIPLISSVDCTFSKPSISSFCHRLQSSFGPKWSSNGPLFGASHRGPSYGSVGRTQGILFRRITTCQRIVAPATNSPSQADGYSSQATCSSKMATARDYFSIICMKFVKSVSHVDSSSMKH